MSSNRPGAPLFGGVLILLAVAGFAYVTAQANHTTSPAQGGSDTAIVPEGLPSTTDTQTAPAPSQEPAAASAVTPAVIYIKPITNGSQLVKRDSAGKETVVFLDTDSKTKLGTVLGIVDGKALAVMTDENGQVQLVEITLDGTGTKNMVNADFGGIAGATLRPTTNTITFAVFDNAERSFGFTLVQEKLDGSNRSSIDQDTQGITLPSWSQSGKTLAYVKGQATPNDGQQIRIAPNGSNPKTTLTAEPNTVITDLTWIDDGSLLYVVEPLGNAAQNKATTMILHTASGEHAQLFDLPGKERSLVVSQQGDWLAAVTGDVDQSGTGSGTLMLIELSSGKQQLLSKASSAGAWITQ